VLFSIATGEGALFQDADMTRPVDRAIKTNEDGIAQCWWRLGETGDQLLGAALLDDEHGGDVDVPLLYSAGLSTADEVEYDASTGGPLASLEPPPDTVQEAIDELARLRRADPGLHVTGMEARDADGNAAPLANDSDTTTDGIAGGVAVVLADGEAVDPAAVGGKPVMSLLLDVPVAFPNRPSPGAPTLLRHYGFAPTLLAGEATAVGNRVVWKPGDGARAWMASELPKIVGAANGPSRLAVRLTLKGNFIWAQGQPDLLLDGDSFGTPRPDGTTALRERSGDDRRGGDFEAWFWLDVVPVETELAGLEIDPGAVVGGDAAGIDRLDLDPDRVVGGQATALDRLDLDPGAVPGGEDVGVANLELDSGQVAGGDEATS
jgi:hypothetical protein